jgi:uncharacterized integral membrane protein
MWWAVCVVVFAYALFLFSVTKLLSSRLQDSHFVAKLALGWALFSLAGFTIWALTVHNDVKVTQSGKFFTAGWKSLSVFRIQIDTWYSYAGLVVYQATRAVVGSYLFNITAPKLRHLQNVVQGGGGAKQLTTENTCARELVSMRLMSNIFYWVSSISDVFFSTSQVDLLVVMLVSGSVVDAVTLTRQCGAARKSRLTSPA